MTLFSVALQTYTYSPFVVAGCPFLSTVFRMNLPVSYVRSPELETSTLDVFHWNVPGVQLHFATEGGKLADTVVLPEDLLAISPAKLLTMKMDMTIVGGRILYERHA